MYGYIYKVFDTLNGYTYVGKRKGEFSTDYYGSGKYIGYAIEDHKELLQHKLIDVAFDYADLNNKEMFWIDFFRNQHVPMYNVADGGPGGDTYTHLTDSDKLTRRINMSNAAKLINANMDQQAAADKRWETRRRLGSDKYSDEIRERFRQGHLNSSYVMSDDTKSKISQSLKGRTLSVEHRQKIGDGNRGLKHNLSQETRDKLVKLGQERIGPKNPFYGKKHTEDTILKIKQTLSNHDVVSGSRWMNNGEINIRVLPPDIDIRISEGFVFGRLQHSYNISEAERKRRANSLRNNLQGKKPWNYGKTKSTDSSMMNTGNNKGKKFLHKGEHTVCVPAENVPDMVAQGYVLGMAPRKRGINR